MIKTLLFTILFSATQTTNEPIVDLYIRTTDTTIVEYTDCQFAHPVVYDIGPQPMLSVMVDCRNPVLFKDEFE